MRGMMTVVAFLLATPILVMGAQVYGTGAGDDAGDIFLLDTIAGTTTFVFNAGTGGLWGAANGDDDDSFFAITDATVLYRIHPVAQTTTLIGTVGMNITGLAYDIYSGVLYGTDYANLYTIDTGTGVPTLIGSLNGPNAVWAIDYVQPIDKIVAVNQTDNAMYTIDTGTGNATYVGPTGEDRITDVWFNDTSDILFGVANLPGRILTLDINTGAATVIGTTTANILGLGWPDLWVLPAEPQTWSDVKAMFR